MNRNFAAALLGLTVIASPVVAEEKAAVSAAVATPKFTTAATIISDILDNAEAKAIVDKHMPGFSSNPQLDMAKGFSLKAVQGFVPDQISDEMLAKIDADFAAMASAK